MSGLKCPRHLWFLINKPDQLPKFDAKTQARFDIGHDVGNYAKKLHPKGIEIPFSNEAIKLTKEALKKRVPLFEATFSHKNSYAKVDLLVPVHKDEWDLYEVKSSGSVKDDHVKDVSFQKYCLEGAGIKLRKCHVMFINNEYVKKGKINPKLLLESEDVTDQLETTVEEQITQLITIIQGKEPKVQLGTECKDPWKCPVCSNEIKGDVANLYWIGNKAWQYYNQGITHIKDLPKDFKYNQKQLIQKANKLHVNKENIHKFLKTLEYPIYCLDFETINPTIPLFDNSHPFQQLPFQYSIHIITKDSIEHKEFLVNHNKDPRKDLIAALKKIGPKGTILAYNASFEKSVIEDLADYSKKDSKWLHALIPRFQDLLTPFKNFDIYHPKQNGSCSIKAVLPAFTETSYKDLSIAEGDTAQLEFMRITYTKVSKEEKEKIRKALLKYCERDTQAMVDILNVLKSL